MRQNVYLIIVSLFTTLAVSSCRWDDIRPPNGRTEIPLNIYYLNTVGVRATVWVTVNGVSNEVIFDTGSWGLRMVKGALSSAGVATEAGAPEYGYGGDFLIKGSVGQGNFSVGYLSSDVKLMLIDSYSVNQAQSWTSTLDSTTIHSLHFNSWPGILGVGLRNSSSSVGITNPFAQLPGNGKYIVRFPLFGGNKGTVLINPTDDDVAGFKLLNLIEGAYQLPNGMNSWLDNEVYGYVNIDGDIIQAPTLLDTGNPIVYVYGATPAAGFVRIGENVTLGINTSLSSTHLIDTSFVVTPATINQNWIYMIRSTVPQIAFGTDFFFYYDVLYDQANGVIGIKKKAP